MPITTNQSNIGRKRSKNAPTTGSLTIVAYCRNCIPVNIPTIPKQIARFVTISLSVLAFNLSRDLSYQERFNQEIKNNPNAIKTMISAIPNNPKRISDNPKSRALLLSDGNWRIALITNNPSRLVSSKNNLDSICFWRAPPIRHVFMSEKCWAHSKAARLPCFTWA